jgi:hypothetical protein
LYNSLIKRLESTGTVSWKPTDTDIVIARVARGQQEGLQYSRDNNIIQDNNIVKGK